jgi:hypothetical protein
LDSRKAIITSLHSPFLITSNLVPNWIALTRQLFAMLPRLFPELQQIKAKTNTGTKTASPSYSFIQPYPEYSKKGTVFSYSHNSSSKASHYHPKIMLD